MSAPHKPRTLKHEIPPAILARIPENLRCLSICHPDEVSVLNDPSNEPPEEPAAPFWVQMYYFQFTLKVETFRGYVDDIRIDGLCSPSDAGRFCLGIRSDINANPMVEKVRRQIGDGCRLTRDADLNVYLQCLSNSPIFVQSPLYAISTEDHMSTVYRMAKSEFTRLNPNQSQDQVIQVFNNEQFNQVVNMNRKKPYGQLRSLQSLCQVRISFVKGFGSSYRRQNITDTPCWVEMFFSDALERLDSALMETPEWQHNLVTS